MKLYGVVFSLLLSLESPWKSFLFTKTCFFLNMVKTASYPLFNRFHFATWTTCGWMYITRDTVSLSKFKSRIQFLPLSMRLPMGYSTFGWYLLRYVRRLVTGVAMKNFHDPNRASVLTPDEFNKTMWNLPILLTEKAYLPSEEATFLRDWNYADLEERG